MPMKPMLWLFMTALSSRAPLTILAVFILTLGVIGSIAGGDWSWFQRTGSLTVLVGGLMALRQPLSRPLQYRVHYDPEFRVRNNKLVGQFIAQFAHHGFDDLDARMQRRGGLLVVVGTFIWGFGDLLNRLPFFQ